ncbi:hypothetical protein [Pseudidiomarina woesei]|uniref:Uncharacterized protein n=1 Tax=Pseudidiomarina woesei TaxID=1381080 RepID=A0A0K6GYZ0_9GAMM|nr:hypothetical protein [Pseudidiomarina woesei]CUA83957.1 hypothetical protein Ga0061064_0822 [Pseudidiomarina woesei]
MSTFELARDNLRIMSVCTAELHAKIDDEIVPESIKSEDMNTQIMHRLKAIRSVQMTDNGTPIWGYHFTYVCGLRYLLVSDGKDDDDAKILFNFTAEFVAKYHSSIELNDEALEAFGRKNVGYHVWPYWRELAHSTVARFELPRFSVPHYFAL